MEPPAVASTTTTTTVKAAAVATTTKSSSTNNDPSGDKYSLVASFVYDSGNEAQDYNDPNHQYNPDHSTPTSLIASSSHGGMVGNPVLPTPTTTTRGTNNNNNNNNNNHDVLTTTVASLQDDEKKMKEDEDHSLTDTTGSRTTNVNYLKSDTTIDDTNSSLVDDSGKAMNEDFNNPNIPITASDRIRIMNTTTSMGLTSSMEHDKNNKPCYDSDAYNLSDNPNGTTNNTLTATTNPEVMLQVRDKSSPTNTEPSGENLNSTHNNTSSFDNLYNLKNPVNNQEQQQQQQQTLTANHLENDNNINNSNNSNNSTTALEPSGIHYIDIPNRTFVDPNEEHPSIAVASSLSSSSSFISTFFRNEHPDDDEEGHQDHHDQICPVQATIPVTTDNYEHNAIEDANNPSSVIIFRTIHDTSLETEERTISFFPSNDDNPDHAPSLYRNNDNNNNNKEPTVLSRTQTSTIISGLDATLPLAVDNDRFFMNDAHDENQDEGYRNVLVDALHRVKMLRTFGSSVTKSTTGRKGNEDVSSTTPRALWCEGNDEIREGTNIVTYFICMLWRMIFQIVICWTSDRINRLFIVRNVGHSLQEHLPFVSAYQSFILSGIIKEFDSDQKPSYHFRLALRNKNLSRILLQQVFLYHRWAFIFHLSTGIRYSRLFSFLSQFTNITSFPITETDSPHLHDTYRQKLRRFFIQTVWYEWFTTLPFVKYVFCGYIRNNEHKLHKYRAGLNLAAEQHGIESYNMERYGTTYGRARTTQFRQENRLDIDESVLRSSMVNIIGTMIHNGIEHVLRRLVSHWKLILYSTNTTTSSSSNNGYNQDINVTTTSSPNGNFAHQRYELLNPFDMLRVTIPEILCTLAGNRGRNFVWDTTVLGPFVRKLQSLDPGRIRKQAQPQQNPKQKASDPTIDMYDPELNRPLKHTDTDYNPNNEPDDNEIIAPCQAAQKLISQLKELIVPNACGNIPSRMEPFLEWLDILYDSFTELSYEALNIRNFISTVDLGIKIGYEVLRTIDWSLPPESQLQQAVIECILDQHQQQSSNHQTHRKHRRSFSSIDTSSTVPRETVISALGKLASKDERTLRELVKSEYSTAKSTVPKSSMMRKTPSNGTLGHKVFQTTAKLLLKRTTTLLRRELHRKALDDRFRDLSKGKVVELMDPNIQKPLQRNHWYWINHKNTGWFIVTFSGIVHSNRSVDSSTAASQVGDTTLGSEQAQKQPTFKYKFLCSVTGVEYIYKPANIQIRQYVPIAEAISRAQKVFMMVELDHCKRFSYNTYMEFGSTMNDTSMRNRLRRLATVAQIYCSELDRARLNVLTETKNSVNNPRKKRPLDFSFGRTRIIQEARPQNAIFLGGGPTGLLGAIHCLHNVILTGGDVKIYEARDAFDQEASSFERAQIVRLDARLVAMLRYHLGTGFEDVFVIAKGESFAHLGNSLPNQGFVEVTIKRLESMLLDEVINLRSKGLLHYFSDSAIAIDEEKGTFEKNGRSLKIGDLICSDLNETLRVSDFVYEQNLRAEQLVVGQDYDIVHPREKRVRRYRLVRMDTEFDWFQFSAYEPGVRDIVGAFCQLPPIYTSGCGRTEPTAIILESEEKVTSTLDFDSVKEKTFQLDVSKSHVILSLGKPGRSKFHFGITTEEPHAIMCIEGIKVSKGMHSFGNKRYGEGLLDDYRTLHTFNTRIVGDFMKSLRISSVVHAMRNKLQESKWKFLFDTLAASLHDKIPAVYQLLETEMMLLAKSTFKRKRIQLRFFELGNNYYLGMELPREYDSWRERTVWKIAPDKCNMTPEPLTVVRKTVQRALSGHIDKLWYESALEVLEDADVYEPQGRQRIPIFFTADSPFEQQLGELQDMEAFRMFRRSYRVHMHEGNGWTQILLQHENSEFRIPSKTYVLDLSINNKRMLEELGRDDLFEPIDTFEVLSKEKSFSVVRSSTGYIAKMPHNVRVGRVSDLSRAPDGYSESKVAFASFPVRHYVCHRAMRINRVQSKGGEDGFITAHIGDSQASPHFMRYSGLTGAGINIMSFNNLVGQALRGIDVEERIQRYVFETNWSTGEVVRRGTGSNYGQDGFLRPGFTYEKMIDFLYDKVVELFEIGAKEHSVLSHDWKVRLAAAIIPRGLENDTLFLKSLMVRVETAIQSKMLEESKQLAGRLKLSPDLWNTISEEKGRISVESLPNKNAIISHSVASTYMQCRDDDCFRTKIRAISCALQLVLLTIKELIDCSIHLRLSNQRISSELYNQPKGVDALTVEFSGEAQTICDGIARAIVLAAAATACLSQSGNLAMTIASIVIAIVTFFVAYDAFFRSVRYRTRNAYHVKNFIENKTTKNLQTIFSLMTKDQRDLCLCHDPYELNLERAVNKFLKNAEFFGVDVSDVNTFTSTYETFKSMDRTELRVIQFMRQLLETFIPYTFHENSYLQEDLVSVYKELLCIRNLCKACPSNGMLGADKAFHKLLSLSPQLEAKFSGKKWRSETFPSAFRFTASRLFTANHLVKESSSILTYMENIAIDSHNKGEISRTIRDVEELNFALLEFDMASAAILSALGAMLHSVIVPIYRVISLAIPSNPDWITIFNLVVTWMTLFVSIGIVIVIPCMLLRLAHLFRITGRLIRLRSKNNVMVWRLQTGTVLQIVVSILQLLSVVAACTSLVWCLIPLTENPTNTTDWNEVWVWISIASVGLLLFAVVMTQIREFFVIFGLDPCLGQRVCNLFRPTIIKIEQSYTVAKTGLEIETPQLLDREKWEYVARAFLRDLRFDMILDPNRLGTIFQYVQSGAKEADPKPDFHDGKLV